jgi:hypothetical protein
MRWIRIGKDLEIRPKTAGVLVEVAVFTQPFHFRGFVKRQLRTIPTYGRAGWDGQPLVYGEIKAIEIEKDSGQFWPVSRTTRVKLPENYPDECRIWGAYHVLVDTLLQKLPEDLYQNPEIQFLG